MEIPPSPRVDVATLVGRYEGLLIDAFGVLLTGAGPLPGAPELIGWLNEQRVPYWIVTNDASRHTERCASWYGSLGLPIAADRIITAGSLLTAAFRDMGLVGAGCIVLGTPDSQRYVREAGGLCCDPRLAAPEDVAVVACCDEAGYDLLEWVDATLTLILRRTERGLPTRLLLANPDVVYPGGDGRVGITCGSVAHLIEHALDHCRSGQDTLRFMPLGKPHRPIFEEAIRRAGTRRLVMIGDSPINDIAGALGAGLAAALVSTGLSRGGPAPGAPRPSYHLTGLWPLEQP